MKSTSGHTGSFDQYLDQFRQRFKFRTVATGIAALVFAAVLITLITLVLGEQLAYSPLLYIPARIVLGLLILGIVASLLWVPLRAFSRSDGIAELEQRVPELQGRAETYNDLHRQRRNSPFTRLLARDAMRATNRSPMHKLLPKADVYGPLVAAGVLILMAGWLYNTVPLTMRAGMAHLWLGWFNSDILPARAIAVTPGDSKIRYGDSFTVNASLAGFESAFAALHIREHDGNWNELEMMPDSETSFAYTLYGITAPLEYYVSSAFTDSDTFSLEVVVPARIESLDLEYHYPQWTGSDPELVQNGSQIAAVAGTRVDLIFATDRPLQRGILIHDNTATDVTQTGDNQYRASLMVELEGTYQLADLLDEDRIPLSDKQPIIVLEDALPEISFVRPGADWNASPIEEVTVSATASDDFAVAKVDLHYSLNGEAWQSIELEPSSQMQHVFYLEDFGSDGESLLPGDLISYYAEAHDREQSVSTDMLFIDVRPFDRRFSQSQQAGGGGAGSQAEQEISQRQKEILVATWNLIREAKENTRSLIKPEDSAALLADLQNTLAAQADTLAQRADARQLLDDDPDIARFVEYMKEAATAMRPSAETLAALKFDEAVKHQQRALQYLKRAESVFNDIRVSRNQSGGGGGGGNAGRDMAEMYELEMDLAKNQYETPDAAQQSSNATQNEQDDAFDRLKDLARRQQKLAEAAQRNEELTMAERWQQERLQRELEALQRELERQQQNASQSDPQQNAQQQSGQQQSGQQQSGQQSGQQQNAKNQSEQNNDQKNADAMQNLQQALEQLRGSQDGEQRAEDLRQALENASRELQQSVEQINQSRQQQLQQQLANAVEQTRDLTRQQRETAEQLRDALERAMSAREQGVIESGLDSQQELELAEQKRQMQRDLQQIREQLGETAERFSGQNPQTAERIEQALTELDEKKTSELLGISGDMIEEGRAPQAALREQQVTEALTDLQNDLLDSASIAEAETGTPFSDQRTVADASRALQQMREALHRAMQRGQSGAQATAGTEPNERRSTQPGRGENQSGEAGQRQAQQGQSGRGQQTANGDSQRQSNQLAENRSGQRQAGSAAPGAGVDLRGGGKARLNLDNLAPGDARSIEQARRELAASLPDLQGQLSAQMLESLEQIARDLKPGDSGENERRINREVGILLRQLEQLELALNRNAMEVEGEGIRAARSSRDPEGYRSRAAEYFRRLSEGLSSGS